MPREMSGAAKALIRGKTGINSAIVVGINWGGIGIEYFATKDIRETDNSGNTQFQAKGAILNVGSIVSQKRTDNVGSTGSVSFTFDDSDGGFKTAFDNSNGQKPLAGIYLYLQNTRSFIPLLIGRLVNPVWNEDRREMSGDIETLVEEDQAGYAPNQDDFTDLSTTAIGVPWPMIFGTPAHVPIAQVKQKALTKLTSGFTLTSDIFTNILPLTIDNHPTLINYNDHEENQIFVEDSSGFPQDQEIKIIINDVVFEGQFKAATPNIFFVTESNVPKFENIEYASNGFDAEAGNNNSVAYKTIVLDSFVPLVNHICYFPAYRDWKICVKQEDVLCYFDTPFINSTTKVFTKPAAGVINRAYAIDPCGTILGTVSKAEAASISYGAAGSFVKDYLSKLKQDPNSFFSVLGNEEVKLYQKEIGDAYIISLIECEEILGVYGKRRIRSADDRQTEKLVPIPTNYYTESLQSAYAIEGNLPSAIIFPTPLKEYVGQDWLDTVYVTARSSVGPNTARIIEHILETFTDLDIDYNSFNEVADYLEPYPSHFALFEKRDAVRLAAEIAWQARCALLYENGKFIIKFLATEPSSVATFNESNIVKGSLSTFTTNINDVYTTLVGTFNQTYQDKRKPSKQYYSKARVVKNIVESLKSGQNDNEIYTRVLTYSANSDLFGDRTTEKEIFIYNDPDSVVQTLAFWGYRLSNCWRMVQFNTFFDGIILQPYDAITMAFSDNLFLRTGSVKAIVESTSFNYKSRQVTVKAWLPIVAGRFSIDSDLVWPG